MDQVSRADVFMALFVLGSILVVAKLARGLFRKDDEPRPQWLPGRAQVLGLESREVGHADSHVMYKGVYANVVRGDDSHFAAWSFDEVHPLRAPRPGAWIPAWYRPDDTERFRLRPPQSALAQRVRAAFALGFALIVIAMIITVYLLISWKG